MEKEINEYCKKILMVLTMYGKLRFNELHRTLTKCNAKMSKPTLIKHLNHLLKKEIIQRDEEDKQRVSYELNLKKLKQLQEVKKINQEILKNEKEFKSMSLNQQIDFTIFILTISELLYLKLTILNILEPENKLQNYYSYNIIRIFYNIYTVWLSDSCKDSKENSQKIIRLINKNIKNINKYLIQNIPT